MRAEISTTKRPSIVRTVGEELRRIAPRAIGSVGLGPLKFRGQFAIPSHGLPAGQAAALQGATFGFNRRTAVAALTSMSLFFGGAVHAQTRSNAGQCEPNVVASVETSNAAAEALSDVMRQLSSPVHRLALGDSERRPLDATIVAAFAALEKLLQVTDLDPMTKAQALADRGDLSLLVASFEQRGQSRSPTLSAARLREQGYADLKEALLILNEVGGHGTGSVLASIGRAVARDSVFSKSEEQLVQAAIEGGRDAGADYVYGSLGLGFSQVFVPDGRADLVDYVGEIRPRFSAVNELAAAPPEVAEDLLRELLRDLTVEQRAGGQKGLVAAQLLYHSLLDGTWDRSFESVMSQVRGPRSQREQGSEVMALGMYLMTHADPRQMARYSLVPDRLLSPLERAGRYADLVLVARKYLDGFDHGQAPSAQHLVALRRALPTISKYDPASAKAAAEQFVEQAKAQLKADPHNLEIYRSAVGDAINSGVRAGNLTPEASAVLQAFYESLPPAR